MSLLARSVSVNNLRTQLLTEEAEADCRGHQDGHPVDRGHLEPDNRL